MIPEPPAEPVDPNRLILTFRRHACPLTPIPTDRQARLTRLDGIRAVLWDIYGTLVVSASGDIAASDAQTRSRAMTEALRAVGLPVDRNTGQRAAAVLAETITRTHGLLKQQGVQYPEVDIRSMLSEVWTCLRAEGFGEEEPNGGFYENLAVEYECRSNPTWPMPGLTQILRQLQQREVAIGIISNAQFYTPLMFPAYLDKSLEALGFDPDLCVFSYRYLEAKPSPQLFHRALEVLTRRGIEPDQVLYAGNDRFNDIWPALHAGMRTALFAGDSRSFRPREADPRIRGLKEDVLLTDLRQLEDVLAIG